MPPPQSYQNPIDLSKHIPYIAPVPTPAFHPSDPNILLAALADPTRALADIAATHNTTLHALALWLTRPDIAARLDDLDALSARRTRSTATSALAAAAATLHAILQDFLTRPAEADPALRLRAMESARRAACALVRLARFSPGPAQRPDRPAQRADRPAPHGTPAPASPARAGEHRVPGRAATTAASTPFHGSIPPPAPAAIPPRPEAVAHAAAHHQRPSAPSSPSSPLQPPPTRELPSLPSDPRSLGVHRPAAHLIAAAGLPGP